MLQQGELVEVRIPYSKPRWGKVQRVQKNGLVVVTLFSPRLRRFVYGSSAYHLSFIRTRQEVTK